MGTSTARSSEPRGRRARRRVSFRTEKRRRNCWPNRTDPEEVMNTATGTVYRWNRIARAKDRSSRQGSAMTLEKLSWWPTRRGFLAGSVGALSVTLFVLAPPSYAQPTTTSDTHAIVVAQPATTRQAAK